MTKTLTGFFSDISLGSALLSLGLAVYVLYINPREMENISFAAGMAAFSLISFGRFMESHSSSPETWNSLALVGRIIVPVPWLVFSLVFARKDPARHLKKWRAVILGVSVTSLVLAGVLISTSVLDGERTFETARYWSSIFLIIALTLVLANFEWTLRSGEHRQRWRIKFLVIGIGSIFLFKIFNLSYLLLFPAEAQDFSLILPSVILVGSCLTAVSFSRRSLAGVGVSVSRDVVRNSIILSLVGASLLLIGSIAAAIRRFGGDFGFYLIGMFVFLAIVFFALILLSTHVRKTVRMFIDRNFFRSKYDYRKEWLHLTDRLSSKLEVRDLSSSLASLFDETFWIDTVGLWLFDEKDDGFRMVHAGKAAKSDPIAWDPALVRFLTEREHPALLDELQGSAELPEAGRGQVALLKARGISLLVPLMLDRQLIGIIGLAGSRYGVPFDAEDLALINTIARQAASSFRSAQLSDSIVRSKELETFHLFSTFVVHDLKNFVSMLSLLARNMENNYGNLEFQRDATASVSRIAEKMQRMMGQLSALSGVPLLHKTRTDVNGMVEEVAGEARKTMRSRLSVDFGELPRIELDPGQMKNVVRNLLMNADQATLHGGRIRLATAVQDGKISISVSDDGCGIPREYIETKLFRLFSTTKSEGFGIGLYQAKRIVDLHGGTIEVESEVGSGSTFRIRLPIPGE